jgi:ankyrin repeat protein
MLAAMEGHLNCCKLIVEAGAQPNIRDRDGKTALDKALEKK